MLAGASCGKGGDEADTLAFAAFIHADGSAFQMSLNTLDAIADLDELLLTLAHEFSRVFTATSTQLGRTDEAIDEFWAGPLLDSVDPSDGYPVSLVRRGASLLERRFRARRVAPAGSRLPGLVVRAERGLPYTLRSHRRVPPT